MDYGEFDARLCQLQEAEMWKRGPVNEDFKAGRDELRYMFLEYIENDDRSKDEKSKLLEGRAHTDLHVYPTRSRRRVRLPPR